MFLDDRKKRILQAIIDDYIDTAEPIGSRTIARKHELGLSSATIRNEMADLEEMGFLAQPHTSAGRIPSDKGYRLYVDELMQVRELSFEEIESIKNALEIKISEMSQLIKQASAIISRITKYTSMAITPMMMKSTLKAIQVVPVESGKALVVVVTNANTVRNCLIKVPENILPGSMIKISNMLNDKLSGLAIDQINLRFIRETANEIGVPNDVLIPILQGAYDCIDQVDNSEVYLDGATNIFNFPEFRDVTRAKEFLNVLDEKGIMLKLLSVCNETKGINIQIGNESGIREIKECSLVTATYSLGDIVIGSLGVIGPTRMEYSKVISSLDYIRKKINAEIGRLLEEDSGSG
jgi:heat-inducible transcriptional repressor